MSIKPEELNGAKISMARILTPGEMRGIARQNGISGREARRSRLGWIVVSDTSPRIIEALEQSTGPAGIRLTAFVGAAGGNYALITYQAGSGQHRFLMPLYEPCVRGMLMSLERQSLVSMLGRDDLRSMKSLTQNLPWHSITPMIAMCQTERIHDVETALSEIALALNAITPCAAIPGINGVAVDSVHVGVVMPEEYCREAPPDAVGTLQ